MIRPAERLQQSLSISVPFLSQIGAEAVFDAQEELQAVLAGYARNREILLNELPGMGFDVLPADGAFYLYADISRHSGDSLDFCAKMLDATGVAHDTGPRFRPAARPFGDQALFCRTGTRYHRGDAAAESLAAVSGQFCPVLEANRTKCFT